MIKINIKKQDIITNSATFLTQEEADTWLAECIANESFGKPEHTIEVTPRSVDENGVVTEATYELIPSEYTVEVVDVTAELALQKESDEAKAYLLATDYKMLKALELGLPLDETIKALRAEARLKVI
jgi:FAD/FMN-containing dehydrogenase